MRQVKIYWKKQRTIYRVGESRSQSAAKSFSRTIRDEGSIQPFELIMPETSPSPVLFFV